jgi:hypothetical protein
VIWSHVVKGMTCVLVPVADALLAASTTGSLATSTTKWPLSMTCDSLVFEFGDIFLSLHLQFSISVLTSYLSTDLGECQIDP